MVSPGAPGSGDVVGFATHPAAPRLAYVVDNGPSLWRTLDAGLDGDCPLVWRRFALPAVPNFNRDSIALDPVELATVYVVTPRGQLRSDDFGQSFLPLLSGPRTADRPQPTMESILVDGGYLYAATDRGVFRGHYEPDESDPVWEPWGLNAAAASNDSTHSFLSFTVDGCDGHGEAIAQDGSTIDTFDIAGCE